MGRGACEVCDHVYPMVGVERGEAQSNGGVSDLSISGATLYIQLVGMDFQELDVEVGAIV